MVFVGSYEATFYSSAVLVTAGALLIITSLLMLLVACANPGTAGTERRPGKEPQPAADTIDVHIGDAVLQRKWCKTCQVMRPLRASHCRKTGRRVDEFDHYCPWIGNTVGRDNYGWFLLFLAYARALNAIFAWLPPLRF